MLPETTVSELHDCCYSISLSVFSFTKLLFKSQEKMFKTSVNARPHFFFLENPIKYPHKTYIARN